RSAGGAREDPQRAAADHRSAVREARAAAADIAGGFAHSRIGALVYAERVAHLRLACYPMPKSKVEEMPCSFSKITSPSSRVPPPALVAPSHRALHVKARGWCCSISTRRQLVKPRRRSGTPAAMQKASHST